MGCITDAMHITSVLNHGAYWDYLHFSFITCPISPEFRGNVLRAVPTTPCSVQGQLGLSKSEQL